MDTQILGTHVAPTPADQAAEAVDTLIHYFGDEAGRALTSQVLHTGNTNLPPPVQAVYEGLLNGQKQAVDSALVRLFAEGFGRAATGGDEQRLKPFIANLLVSSALQALTAEGAREHLPEATRGPMATLGTVLALMREMGAKTPKDPAATIRQIDGLDAKVHALLPDGVRDALAGLRQQCRQAVDTAKASTKTTTGDPFADAAEAHPAPPPAAKPSAPPPLPPTEEVEIPPVKLVDPPTPMVADPSNASPETEPAPKADPDSATTEDPHETVEWDRGPLAPITPPMHRGWVDTVREWPPGAKLVAAALISLVLIMTVAQVLNSWTGTPTVFAPRVTNHSAPARIVAPTVPPVPSPSSTAAPTPAAPVAPPPAQNTLPPLPSGVHAGQVPSAWYAEHGAAFDCGNDAVTNGDGTVDMTACGRMPR